MAGKVAKKVASKTAKEVRKSGPKGFLVFVIGILLGLYIGIGGVNVNDGRVSFNVPTAEQFSDMFSEFRMPLPKPTPSQSTTNDSTPPAEGIQKSFLGSGYGNCVVAKINSVYDGDTFRCDIAGVPDIIGKNISIRVNGIDTPEMKDKDQYVRMKAVDAKNLAQRKLLGAKKVELRNIDRGKYFRIIADVYVDGESLSKIMLDSGLANEYDGGTKQEW